MSGLAGLIGGAKRLRPPIVTLLTDFGLKDPYVAEMKAVILSICPEARIVDVSHMVKKFDVRMGAFILAQASPYFPAGTVHVAVVDPGVGTERRPIIVEAKRSFYVGPDNGVLMLSAKREGILHIYEIKNRKYMLQKISRTFHGRDVFSPAAAHLALGVPPSLFGPEVSDPVVPEFAEARVSGRNVLGEVVHVDDFGNLVTNISLENLLEVGIEEGGSLRVEIGGRKLDLRLCTAYGEAAPGEILTLIGGTGFLEVSVNMGNASQTLGCGVGEPVRITHPGKAGL